LKTEAGFTATSKPPGAPLSPGWNGTGSPGQQHRLLASLLLMLGIGLVPALLGTLVYLQQMRSVAVRDAYAQVDLLAGSATQSLGWLMQDAQEAMSRLAARPATQALDRVHCDGIFTEFRDLNRTFRALSLRRVDGSSVCSELKAPPSQQSVADAPWFRAAILRSGFHATDVHRGTVNQVWTSRLTYPVHGPSGQVEGLIIAPLDLHELGQRLFASMKPPAVGAVVDGSRHIVLRSAQQDERVGKDAAHGVAQVLLGWAQEPAPAASATRRFVETGIDGVRRLYAVHRVPLTEWSVVAALPLNETLQPYYDARNRTLAAVALVLLTAGFAAWRVAGGILQSVGGTSRAARAMAAGDMTHRAPETGPREMVELAREFNRMVGIVADSREQLRASESHYRALIRELPVAVVSHRPDGTVKDFNERACQLLRMSAELLQDGAPEGAAWQLVDAQGRPLPRAERPSARVLSTGQAMPPTLLGITDGQQEPAAASMSSPAAPPRLFPAGHVPHTWALVSGYAQWDAAGEVTGAIIVFVDVTAERESESLRLAKESAEAASKAKSVFLSRMSHELRTPLNAINGFSELMLTDPAVPDAPKARLQHILHAGQHLLTLINQVLDLASIESGRLMPADTPLSLDPVLHACLAMSAPLAAAHGVELVAPPPVEGQDEHIVLGDATRVRQILMNLLSNAIQYNRQGGTVKVAVSRAALPDGSPGVRVDVTDTGPGLGEEQVRALFQPFNRLGAQHTGVEGHGLGLSISRLLAVSMSARLEVTSAPGSGSTFMLHMRSAVGAV